MINKEKAGSSSWKKKVFKIVFLSDSPLGKLFDLLLLAFIVTSVLVTMLETIPFFHSNYFYEFQTIEIIFTAVFTLEYLLRIWCVKKPINYIFSLYGLIDLFSILPTFIGLFIKGTHYLTVLRLFRVLRMFRILKLTKYIKESSILLNSVINSRRKIFVFFLFLFITVCFLGSIMYAIESESNPGFKSIPESIYWAIVTITTVGYGDISPITPLGKIIASLIMILGYSIIAVPTGIITAGLFQNTSQGSVTCPNCLTEGHEEHASFCKDCGMQLNENNNSK
jgi:voltage-gated potassium channel